MLARKFKLSLLTLSLCFSCHQSALADPDVLSTQPTGMITGTAPVIYNLKGEAGRIDIKKDDKRDASRELDVGDTLTINWQLQDQEGDADASLSSVVWTCDHPQKGQRILAEKVSSYTITTADLGCKIGLTLQPKTVTGAPAENESLTIGDISSYDENDNILPGPVNPHAINITDYIVAPGTDQSRTVPADLILHTGWSGAKVQLETDNLSSQLEWKSSDSSIATVSSDGIVTFLTKGEVTITVKHNEVEKSITFNPSLFYVFGTTTMVWADAMSWCAEQGYTVPDTDHLSTEKNKRVIPADALWQEWGDISKQGAKHAGVVLWSSDEWEGGHAYYMYISDGRVTSNNEDVREGVVCLMP